MSNKIIEEIKNAVSKIDDEILAKGGEFIGRQVMELIIEQVKDSETEIDNSVLIGMKEALADFNPDAEPETQEEVEF